MDPARRDHGAEGAHSLAGGAAALPGPAAGRRAAEPQWGPAGKWRPRECVGAGLGPGFPVQLAEAAEGVSMHFNQPLARPAQEKQTQHAWTCTEVRGQHSWGWVSWGLGSAVASPEAVIRLPCGVILGGCLVQRRRGQAGHPEGPTQHHHLAQRPQGLSDPILQREPRGSEVQRGQGPCRCHSPEAGGERVVCAPAWTLIAGAGSRGHLTIIFTPRHPCYTWPCSSRRWEQTSHWRPPASLRAGSSCWGSASARPAPSPAPGWGACAELLLWHRPAMGGLPLLPLASAAEEAGAAAGPGAPLGALGDASAWPSGGAGALARWQLPRGAWRGEDGQVQGACSGPGALSRRPRPRPICAASYRQRLHQRLHEEEAALQQLVAEWVGPASGRGPWRASQATALVTDP